MAIAMGLCNGSIALFCSGMPTNTHHRCHAVHEQMVKQLEKHASTDPKYGYGLELIIYPQRPINAWYGISPGHLAVKHSSFCSHMELLHAVG